MFYGKPKSVFGEKSFPRVFQKTENPGGFSQLRKTFHGFLENI
jgi:hypothetical protein